MALSNKNIVITPNIGAASDPKIVFSGADASTAAQNITLTAYPTNGGTLSFDGSVGQLFSVTNSMTGTIFSANDVSGIPSIEVLDTGLVKIAQYTGNLVIGSGIDTGLAKLQVTGDTVLGPSATLGSAIGITKSNRLIGRYSVTTSPSLISCFMDYNNNGTVTMTDAIALSSMVGIIDNSSNISETNALTAYGTNYGSKNAGLSFISGNANAALAGSVGLEPSNMSSVNAVIVGYTTNGPRIVLQDNALDSSQVNVTTYVSASHKFVAGVSGSETTGLYINNSGNVVVGGTTTTASALLRVSSITQGFLPPLMTTAQKTAIASPATGLMVFDTTLGKLCVCVAGTWQTITSA